MLVKYIKDGVSAKLGAIRHHSKEHAHVLIKLGICVPYNGVSEHNDQQPAPTAKRGRPPKKGEAFGINTGTATNEKPTKQPNEKAAS